NGSITASASSSNGTVKYGLTDFDYVLEGQTSGTFTGLGVGQYTVYAKDANGCTTQVTVIIIYQPQTQEHYRLNYRVLGTGEGTPWQERISIYEQEYVGSIVELDYGDTIPFELLKPKPEGGEVDDPFIPLHPTSGSIFITAEENYLFL